MIDLVHKNFAAIKEVFTGAVAAGGAMPDINQLYFLEFCREAHIPDQAVTPSVLDVYFTATNFEVVEAEGNDDRALCRFEFVEILARIARGKYLDTGKCATYAAGVAKLLEEHILPMRDKLEPWQPFREQHLWNTPVNDLLLVNLPLLKKVFAKMQRITPYMRRGPDQNSVAAAKMLHYANLAEAITT